MPFHVAVILAMIVWFAILFAAMAISSHGAKRRAQGDEMAEMASMFRNVWSDRN